MNELFRNSVVCYITGGRTLSARPRPDESDEFIRNMVADWEYKLGVAIWIESR
jgi:hypothetical protein